MSLCLYSAHTAVQRRVKTLFLLHSYRDPKSYCCENRALLTFLLRSLASIPRFYGVSSSLSARPKKLKQWLLYGSKQYIIITYDVNDNVKSSICKYFRTYI